MFVPFPYLPPRKGARYSYGQDSWLALAVWFVGSLVFSTIVGAILILTGAI